ncbi:biofilm development regulator YmgB/AriR family protein [Rahnella victoriana]|uniref:Uncharacterized protein n=1 Tax=Rahnella victoriana TaxID=1510570 RepID=A0ABS0DMH3_9GAMM|nr:biofilm development regulator YmgB/AriR family protein [Rahnella victoriana]MBF7954583.1 hypothetical protein [Rahnella victoriana]
MEQKHSTVDQIDEYFQSLNEAEPNEKDSFYLLFSELASLHDTVSHKDMIASLIQKLETEQDVMKADVYRNMLEMLLRSTNS